MNRNLWAVAVISVLALCWATAFLGAASQGVIASIEGFESRMGQIEPDYRTDAFAALLAGDEAVLGRETSPF